MTTYKQLLQSSMARKNRAKEMRKTGMTYASIGKRLGVSRQRVQQLLASDKKKA